MGIFLRKQRLQLWHQVKIAPLWNSLDEAREWANKQNHTVPDRKQAISSWGKQEIFQGLFFLLLVLVMCFRILALKLLSLKWATYSPDSDGVSDSRTKETTFSAHLETHTLHCSPQALLQPLTGCFYHCTNWTRRDPWYWLSRLLWKFPFVLGPRFLPCRILI